MKEREVVQHTKTVHTRESLGKDLSALGITKEDIVLVHSSLSKIGWIVGGQEALVQALKDTAGTIIMPSQTGANSEPSYWQDPPVPKSWWPSIRASMPPFSRTSPTRDMGCVVEHFLMDPEVIRSSHPQVSFAGWGEKAASILEEHSLSRGLGSCSPLQKLYDLNAKVLLLGVGYENCTCLHLSESQWKDVVIYEQGASILEDGRAVWKTFEEIRYDDSDFAKIGAAYEESGLPVSKNHLGRLVPLRPLCDFGKQWIEENRKKELSHES